MRKVMLIIFSVFLLTACTDTEDSKGGNVKGEDTNTSLGELKADESDFKGSGFRNKNGQLIAWVDKGLYVTGTLSPESAGYRTDIDTVLEKESVELGASFSKIYEDAEIKTDGLKYYIELDRNISLEFEKVGDRMIKDSQGIEYYTQEYPE
ncbi:hypothetical protein [Lysinibacillus sp. 54212]|uniref:hypothetical protein n=1 Tax=Lysinibacillus sp. 54212 TaxID=3119829 RepID=UPI002FC9A8E2